MQVEEVRWVGWVVGRCSKYKKGKTDRQTDRQTQDKARRGKARQGKARQGRHLLEVRARAAMMTRYA